MLGKMLTKPLNRTTMSDKTAITQAIEIQQGRYDSLKLGLSENSVSFLDETSLTLCMTVIQDSINTLTELLQTEKEQIQRAYNIGMTDADIKSSEQYYNDTYGAPSPPENIISENQ